MRNTKYRPVDLDHVEFDVTATIGARAGERLFGNTVIAWVPSSTEASVLVTVSLGGTPIAQKSLTPQDNELSYRGESGADWTEGMLAASFGGSGRSGQLNGTLRWFYLGSPGHYQGFIGAW